MSLKKLTVFDDSGSFLATTKGNELTGLKRVNQRIKIGGGDGFIVLCKLSATETCSGSRCHNFMMCWKDKNPDSEGFITV